MARTDGMMRFEFVDVGDTVSLQAHGISPRWAFDEGAATPPIRCSQDSLHGTWPIHLTSPQGRHETRQCPHGKLQEAILFRIICFPKTKNLSATPSRERGPVANGSQCFNPRGQAGAAAFCDERRGRVRLAAQGMTAGDDIVANNSRFSKLGSKFDAGAAKLISSGDSFLLDWEFDA